MRISRLLTSLGIRNEIVRDLDAIAKKLDLQEEIDEYILDVLREAPSAKGPQCSSIFKYTPPYQK